jgi:DNA-binding sugar fermentation-stimulating protein
MSHQHQIVYRYASPLIKSIFVERLNRFVCRISQKTDASVPLSDIEDCYCPNTGSMLNLVPTIDRPRLDCWVSVHTGTTSRKYAKTLELVYDTGAWVGIQSRLANEMFENALNLNLIPELRGFSECNREVVVAARGEHARKQKDKDSRTDFQLLWREAVQPVTAADAADAAVVTATPEQTGKAPAVRTSKEIFASFAFKEANQCTSTPAPSLPLGPVTSNMLVEVKSVTLAEALHEPAGLRRASFPDCVSERASKHLRCLMDHKLRNPAQHRSVVFFLIQRDDCNSFTTCHLDPVYTQLLGEAIESGVEVLAYSVQLHPETGTVSWGVRVPYVPNPLPPSVNLEPVSAAKKRRKIS